MVFKYRLKWTLLLGGILSPWNDLLTRFISVQYHEYQWNTGILYNKKYLKCRRNMACYFNYFVDSVECSNDNVIPKNHTEKEIQIVFTECGILPDNVNSLYKFLRMSIFYISW